ncbi:chitinase [Saccharopolyspora phatthalungensis]|uniref:chitinase n=1 Tax=Saccharopolyspora phatthalungensis TaxID=664693 RepID=A0A840QEU7_9PSEU|nr:chitinase [Saccharopolyspora phatthalungensis]
MDRRRRRTVGYFTSWGVYGSADRPRYTARDARISGTAARLDHLVYCFANISAGLRVVLGDPWADAEMPFPAVDSVDGVADDPGQPLRGNLNQLRKLKVAYPRLRISVAIGGPHWSGRFPQAATAKSRDEFISSAIDLFLRGNVPGLPVGAAAGIFDGIDLDWEFPQAADEANLAALVAEFRCRLDLLTAESGRRFLLTAWVPAAEELAAHWDRTQLGDFDFVVVQGYDLHGPWESTTNFASALSSDAPNRTWFTCDRAVAAWRAKRARTRNLLLGIPFYCHGWTEVEPGRSGDGLWQPGVGIGDPPTYRGLRSVPGQMHRRSGMGAWKYDPAGKRFFSVDDTAVMAEKAAWVATRGLGGVAAWELGGDTPDGELLAALRSGLSV